MNTTDENSHSFVDENGRVDYFQFLGLSYGYMALDQEASRIRQIAREISEVYIWILFAIGLPGNILTIITITAMKSLCPATFFISLLAALDTTSLILKLTGHELIRNQCGIGWVGCKFEFILPYLSTLANWVIVLICAERFFTVCFKEKKAVIFTLRNCYIVVAVLSAVLIILFAGISMPMRSMARSGQCGTYTRFVWFWVNVWCWINAFLYLFLPSTLIIPMTARMLFKLRGSNTSRILQENEDKISESKASVSRKPTLTEAELEDNKGAFTLVVFLAAIFFIVFCLPACIFVLSYHHDDNVLTTARWILYEQIQFVLADSTHVINFFLYFLSAKKLRAKALEVVLCKPCRRTSYTPGQRLD